MLGEINRLRQMTVAELQVRWREMYGEETRSRNRSYLWRRLAWRLQELQFGGLSGAARARLIELAPDGLQPRKPPHTATQASPQPVSRPVRDMRLPTPGTVILRKYKGRDLRLVVRDDGFELDGAMFRSLSEAARAVTGSKWNGRLFWGLTQRSRRT